MTSASFHRKQVKVLRGDSAQVLDNKVFSAFDPATTRLTTNPAAAAEAARDAAFEQGYTAGLDAARHDVEAATEDANKRVRRALAALCEAVDAFDQRQTIALADVEDAITEGSFLLAKAILKKELSVTIDPGAEAIARAMKLLPENADVVARLNPQDVETLSMDSVSTTTRTVQVVADASVEVGGCIVDAGNTRIDSQLSSVLANVAQVLSLSNVSVAEGISASNSRMTASEAPLS